MESCFYFDGQTAQSHECSLHIEGGNLYIYFTHQQGKLIIWNKSNIKYFDLKGNHLIIKYGDFPQQAVEYKNANSSILYEQLSENNIAKKSKSIWLKNKTTIAITLCVAFVAICLGSFFIVLPWVGEKAVNLIPESVEAELGNAIAESILQTSTEEDSATYYANEFVSKLKINSTYSIQINVIESNDINAFALPGGKIFVYSGIVKNLNNYEEFTALLGHEISHVENQHSLKSICRTIASSIFIACLFGDVTGISSGIIEQADQFKQLNYSRELEMQADNKGFDLMIDNNVSPKGMIDLLKLLQKESHETPDFMKYFSTHPKTEERIKNIQIKSRVATIFKENDDLKLIFNKMKSHLD